MSTSFIDQEAIATKIADHINDCDEDAFSDKTNIENFERNCVNLLNIMVEFGIIKGESDSPRSSQSDKKEIPLIVISEGSEENNAEQKVSGLDCEEDPFGQDFDLDIYYQNEIAELQEILGLTEQDI